MASPMVENWPTGYLSDDDADSRWMAAELAQSPQIGKAGAPDSVATPVGALGKTRVWAALIRDLAIILAVPGVLYVGLELYDVQAKATDVHVKAVEAEVEALQTQGGAVAKALDLLATQKVLFEQDRQQLQELQGQTLQFNTRLQQLQDDLQQSQSRTRHRPSRGG
jgi:hypothetical protein